MYGQCALDGTVKVFTPWAASKPYIQWDNGIKVPIPANAAYGGFDASDTHAIFSSVTDGVYYVDMVTKEVKRLGNAYGINGVAIAKDGETPVYVNGPLTYKIGDKEYTRPEAYSEGFLYLKEDGHPYWFAEHRKYVVGGYTYYERSFSPDGNWLIGVVGEREGCLAYNFQEKKTYLVSSSSDVPYTIPRINNKGTAAIGLYGEFIDKEDFVLLDNEEPIATNQRVKPFPQPIWIMGYHSMNLRQDYGDNHNYQGNVVMINDGGKENALRVARMGYPLIIDPAHFDISFASLVVAYYLHCQTLDEVYSKQRATEHLIQTGKITEAPIILYYDDEVFPLSILDDLNPEHYWISAQCYRGVNEPIGVFRDRVYYQLKKISEKGFYQIPTWQFYTRNGAVPPVHAEETFPLIRPLFDDEKLIGLACFSDMRPTGMNDNPSFRRFFNELCWNNLERPNRYTGWTPRNIDERTVLSNILSQNKFQFVLNKEQRDYLKSKLYK